MINANHDTAILVFSRPNAVEAESKELIPYHKEKNLHSLKGLKKNALLLAQNTGLPTIAIESQQGSTFGERLAYAFRRVFELGYEHVIAIGGDCPALTKEDLILSAEKVKFGTPVLGPDKRNGVYLIGLSRAQFESKSFASLPWQSRKTFTALSKHLGNPYLLKTKQDLNNEFDLKLVIENSIGKIRGLLLSFLKLERNSTVSMKQEYCTANLPHSALRGPPQPSR